jgi:predicted PurR-regulated permease PerM
MVGSRSSSAGTLIKSLAVVAGLLLAVLLLWGMRSLIAPVAVGSLLAYVCYPLVAGLERFRLTRGLAISLLLLGFLASGLFLINRVRAAMPTEVGALELRVRALRNVNRRYKALMGLDPSLTKGNSLYRILHNDLDPLMDRVNRFLALTAEESAKFHSVHPDRPNPSTSSDPLLDYQREDEETFRVRGRTALARPGPFPELAGPSAKTAKTPLAALGAILSTWVVAPAVFLFLLRDTGEIKRGFLRTIPNRLFEPALAILTDLDRAIGGYVRGIFLESTFLGTSVAVLLVVLGAPIGWAILIGLVAGAANPIPYVGSAVALVGGLAFAVLADNARPLLPIIRPESIAIWIFAGILLIEAFKGVVFEPLVLGDSVKLHPLVVLIGALTGGLMFGLVGLLLALPTITILKTLISSASHQLKAYGLT